MTGSREDDEQKRRALWQQREKEAIQSLGLPYLVPGMSHNAVAVQLKRARRQMEVRDRLLKAWEEEKRALQQAPPPGIHTVEDAARAILNALDQGGEQKERAERFLKTKAHPLVKEKVLELVGAASQWKERRSRKTNGY